jgi:hypothetical protein
MHYTYFYVWHQIMLKGTMPLCNDGISLAMFSMRGGKASE